MLRSRSNTCNNVKLILDTVVDTQSCEKLEIHKQRRRDLKSYSPYFTFLQPSSALSLSTMDALLAPVQDLLEGQIVSLASNKTGLEY